MKSLHSHVKRSDLGERVEYLTSLKIMTSDKYGIWGLDALGIIAGMVLIIWGLFNYNFSGIWRFLLIIIGVFLLTLCSFRINKRYSQFKINLLKDIERLQQ